ncbi:spore coat putative kinase YutH [Bacillus sp. REN10]|uniref:spore coat putative kinase YutH n=1 Tax=Bacillus sp. REN10 TaxID=2782541 RepID=UPI00193B4CB0|nr:spore coat protein YutH [Bacillus sp. REN10]
MDGKELLRKHFRITPERMVNGRYYESEGFLYSIVDVTNMEQEYLVELHQMSQHLMQQGDQKVAVFIPSVSGAFLVTEDKRDVVVLGSSNVRSSSQATGSKLARFHRRGRSFTQEVKAMSQLGRWRARWEQELDQLETSISSVIKKGVDSEFAAMVIDSFPYYMGLAENAIQYVMDTEIDETPGTTDYGTICHHSFHTKLWVNRDFIHHPFDWVYDHPARDVAEWIRSSYWEGTLLYRSNFQQFLHEYQQAEPLSPFSWRLIYARLLFPAHYFDCSRAYFSSRSLHEKKEKEERLKKYMKNTTEYERFLASFYERASIPASRMKIPDITWLK